jgi:EAL domain-containing protein (putative c-di-GMP-specific phosphodiesterase class I)
MMTTNNKDTLLRSDAFGRRSPRPRVCIVDGKPRNHTFLIEALEEIGFITVECTNASEMPILQVRTFSFVVLGPSISDIDIDKVLQTLAAVQFEGKVLPIAVPGSILAFAIRERAHNFGIDTLPPLPALFTADMLHKSIAPLIPAETPPSAIVDVTEALDAGWLELWYQPKIDIRTLLPRGAEALIRMRHPAWGTVLPTGFLPDHEDPAFRHLSGFVIGQAMDDWYYFIEHNGPMDLSINLPVSSLLDRSVVTALCHKIPAHWAFGELVVELKCTEVLANLDLVIDIADRIRAHKIAVSIEDIGADWPALAAITTVPFIEFKVDRRFITGFGDDRLKQSVCRGIVDLANERGIRTVAEGIESPADFATARQLGFDVAQGFLFSKAMTARQFVHTTLTRPVTLPE